MLGSQGIVVKCASAIFFRTVEQPRREWGGGLRRLMVLQNQVSDGRLEPNSAFSATLNNKQKLTTSKPEWN